MKRISLCLMLIIPILLLIINLKIGSEWMFFGTGLIIVFEIIILKVKNMEVNKNGN